MVRILALLRQISYIKTTIINQIIRIIIMSTIIVVVVTIIAAEVITIITDPPIIEVTITEAKILKIIIREINLYQRVTIVTEKVIINRIVGSIIRGIIIIRAEISEVTITVEIIIEVTIILHSYIKWLIILQIPIRIQIQTKSINHRLKIVVHQL
jgi:hypothetical protein